MIDFERAMTETTLGLQNAHNTTDQEEAFAIPDLLFSSDHEYISEDELEDPGTDESEVEEDLGGLESGPLELEEMSDMHEDLTQVSSELEAVAILNLPPILTRHEPPMRRPPVRRRRSDGALVRVMVPLGNSPAEAEKSALEFASEAANELPPFVPN